MNLFFANSVLGLIGCVIAALLGFSARKGKRWRFLKALVVAILFSWTGWSTGGGHGGGGILPSVYLFCIVVLVSKLDIAVVSEDGGLTEIFLSLVIMVGGFICILLSFWFFSRPSKELEKLCRTMQANH